VCVFASSVRASLHCVHRPPPCTRLRWQSVQGVAKVRATFVSILTFMADSVHFSDHELACHHCGVNGCQALLVGQLEVLRALISEALGRDTPVYIDSAFRCAEWNEATKHAASHSQHLLGNAADLRVAGMSAAKLWAFVQKVPGFKGVGRSDPGGFVHVDVREVPARWCYDSEGATIDWYDPPASNVEVVS